MTVNLSGPWVADNDCCTLSANTPVIVSDPVGVAAPTGLFTFQNNNEQVDVFSTDVTASGPGGTTFKITTSAASTSNCLASTPDVEYTVDIVNPCPTAVLTVD